MKNNELISICYKFFNKFITADELIEMLTNLDKKNDEINIMIDEIKKIISDTPSVEDEYIIKKKETIQKLINRIEAIPKDETNEKFLNKELNNLKKDYKKKIDSYDRWFKITDYINNNNYFNKCINSFSNYEMLELITQYISAPFPPQLNQEEFDKLVKVGIEEDNRECLWRLAFNYEKRNINLDNIVDYYIDKKDGYYIAELISAVGEKLNIDNIIDKINDNELIKDLEKRKSIMSNHVSEEQFNRLINKFN